jgi:hypothetical protein
VNVRGEVEAMRVFRNLFRLLWQFLAPTFKRVRKIAQSDYELRHVCLSLCVEQLGLQLTNIHKI